MKKWLSAVGFGESGQALVTVLAMMALGSLLAIPVLNFTSTSLKTTQMFKEDLAGLYAADAGVEDALWKLKYDTPDDSDLPYEYQIADINGLPVDIEIDKIVELAGEPVGSTGHDDEDLILETLVTYDAGTGNYTYTLSVTNNGSGLLNVKKILINFPPDVDYVPGSTSTNVTLPEYSEPSVSGSPDTGITLVWSNDASFPKIAVDETKYHIFKLSGPPDIAGIEGNGYVKVNRENIGTVWLGDIIPYSITAESKDASEAVITTIRAGVWAGGGIIDISCWEIQR